MYGWRSEVNRRGHDSGAVYLVLRQGVSVDLGSLMIGLGWAGAVSKLQGPSYCCIPASAPPYPAFYIDAGC